jgi:DNA polymerase-3 subunit chi
MQACVTGTRQMPARVDFYVLKDQMSPEEFACAIAAKLLRQGLGMHVHTDSRANAVTLDEYLWTCRDISFLPHKLVDDRELGDTPITIGWNGSSYPEVPVLINLDADVPDFAGAYSRIIEIAAGYDPLRTLARSRYRTYRERGFELHDHEIESRDAGF